jgi:hypothetical protein
MRAHMTMWDIAKRGEPARNFVSMARAWRNAIPHGLLMVSPKR